MKRKSRNSTILSLTSGLLASLFCIVADDARADSLVLPNYAASNQAPNNGEGLFTSVLRQQTVYGSSEFPAYPIVINELRWRPDSAINGPFTATVSDIQINLSTTTNSPDHLSSIFAQKRRHQRYRGV